ncbi:unnamed protein product [Somion occarium]|uniref:DUF6534 domain-containing protein n=1 Tax=Somion occarium TaxID=3059160 RepID=A0ABP1DUL3_9APHY
MPASSALHRGAIGLIPSVLRLLHIKALCLGPSRCVFELYLSLWTPSFSLSFYRLSLQVIMSYNTLIGLDSIPTPEQWLGGVFILVCLSLVLYGIAVAQAYSYMLNCKNDGMPLRTAVLATILLETFQTASLLHLAWAYAIAGFGNFVASLHIPWSAGASIILEVAIVFLVQGFYLRRIWILSKKSKLLTGLMGVLLLTRVALGLATGICICLSGTWIEFRDEAHYSTILTCSHASAVVLDLSMTLLLMFHIYQYKTGFTRTDDVVRSLVVYVVHTGATTTLVSIAIILTYQLVHNSLLFAGFYAIQSKLYANSLLGMLNTRDMRKGRMFATDAVDLSHRTSIYASQINPQGMPIDMLSETCMTTDLSDGSQTKKPQGQLVFA